MATTCFKILLLDNCEVNRATMETLLGVALADHTDIQPEFNGAPVLELDAALEQYKPHLVIGEPYHLDDGFEFNSACRKVRGRMQAIKAAGARLLVVTNEPRFIDPTFGAPQFHKPGCPVQIMELVTEAAAQLQAA